MCYKTGCFATRQVSRGAGEPAKGPPSAGVSTETWVTDRTVNFSGGSRG